MLHDVMVSVYDAVTRRGGNHVFTVEADGGDDAVAQAKVMAAELGSFRVVSVYPSAPAAPPPPVAEVEGAEGEPEDADAEPVKRGPGRPRKVAENA